MGTVTLQVGAVVLAPLLHYGLLLDAEEGEVSSGSGGQRKATPLDRASALSPWPQAATTSTKRPEWTSTVGRTLREPRERQRVPEWSSLYQRCEALVALELAVCLKAQAGAAGKHEGKLMQAIEVLVSLLVVPHGLTDLWALPLIPMGVTYAVCCVLGGLCDERWLPLIGAVASVAHFAMDLGWCFSSALVLACITCHVRSFDQGAYCMLLGYMLSVHLPYHYLRVIPDTPLLGWMLLAAFAAASYLAKPLVLMQCSGLCRRAAVTLIVAHTVANSWTCV